VSETRIEIPVEVETDDGKKHAAIVRIPDLARTEGKLGVSLASFGDEMPSFEFLLTATYFALRRKGDAPDNFDLWFDSIVDFDTEEQQGEVEAPSAEEAQLTSSPA
jgi:hypothetical protein